jgi:hypothetical protein
VRQSQLFLEGQAAHTVQAAKHHLPTAGNSLRYFKNTLRNDKQALAHHHPPPSGGGRRAATAPAPALTTTTTAITTTASTLPPPHLMQPTTAEPGGAADADADADADAAQAQAAAAAAEAAAQQRQAAAAEEEEAEAEAEAARRASRAEDAEYGRLTAFLTDAQVDQILIEKIAVPPPTTHLTTTNCSAHLFTRTLLVWLRWIILGVGGARRQALGLSVRDFASALLCFALLCSALLSCSVALILLCAS